MVNEHSAFTHSGMVSRRTAAALASLLLISDVESITSCFSGSGLKGKGRGVAAGRR